MSDEITVYERDGKYYANTPRDMMLSEVDKRVSRMLSRPAYVENSKRLTGDIVQHEIVVADLDKYIGDLRDVESDIPIGSENAKVSEVFATMLAPRSQFVQGLIATQGQGVKYLIEIDALELHFEEIQVKWWLQPTKATLPEGPKWTTINRKGKK